MIFPQRGQPHTHESLGTLRSWNTRTQLWTVELDVKYDPESGPQPGTMMQVPARNLLVKPLIRIPSAEITRAWLYASEGVVSRDPDSMLRQLLRYVPSYTPAFVPMSYADKWPFITRILVNYHRWETQSLEERSQTIDSLRLAFSETELYEPAATAGAEASTATRQARPPNVRPRVRIEDLPHPPPRALPPPVPLRDRVLPAPKKAPPMLKEAPPVLKAPPPSPKKATYIEGTTTGSA